MPLHCKFVCVMRRRKRRGRGRREELGVGVGLTVQLWDPCAQIGGDLALVVPLSDTWM